MVTRTIESLFFETIPGLKEIHSMTYDLYNSEYTFSLFLIGYGLDLEFVQILVSQAMNQNVDMELKYVLKHDDSIEYCFMINALSFRTKY